MNEFFTDFGKAVIKQFTDIMAAEAVKSFINLMRSGFGASSANIATNAVVTAGTTAGTTGATAGTTATGTSGLVAGATVGATAVATDWMINTEEGRQFFTDYNPFSSTYNTLSDAANDFGKNISNLFGGGGESANENSEVTYQGKTYRWKDNQEAYWSAFWALAKELAEAERKKLDESGWTFDWSTFDADVASGKTKLGSFASGIRNFAGGLAMVGEAGRELVRLPAGSDVFSNVETEQVLAGTGERSINITINASGPNNRKFAKEISDEIYRTIKHNVKF